MIRGGIEAGGTKFIVGVGSAEAGSVGTMRIETGEPEETLRRAADFLRANSPPEGLAGIGIGSFGPIDVDPSSLRYGTILATPKLAWRDFPLRRRLTELTGIAATVDTDVNAAALAEATLGAGAGRGDLAYVTVGTGIGVGLVVDGRPVHGIAHPEIGHILPRRDPRHEGFAGICPYHGDCLEGLASGPAIAAAWGARPDRLPPEHPAWAIEASYLAQLCASLILTLAPATIVIGGGVMAQPDLIGMIRARTAVLLGGYVTASDAAALEQRIVSPACREPPGLIGAYLLALQGEDLAASQKRATRPAP